jgi:uncharacterized membrane protein
MVPHPWRVAARISTALFFTLAGLNHFRDAKFYRQIVPPHFGNPEWIVALSGIAEIAGGIGLMIQPLRRAAGWGLIALLICVFPANLYMAMSPQRIPHMHFPQWALWLRLPLQGLFIALVWFASLSNGADKT